ncbi:hypothetical protein F5Y08DRAFT_16148 [Xylaria arbuscula]|nr:hypothetical protein F5Y08DRAFT_16148 [Xylaria arbuscula]
MELPATTSSMNLMSNFQCSREQQQSIVKRAPWCNADNCYRALFPCPSPSAVTEAVRFCGTVSADSATNYPTRAIDACGTSKDRYISACSCPATNCPVAESVAKTTTSQQTTQHTVPLVVTTTIPEKVSSVYDPAGKVTVDQVPATEPDAGATPTATVNNVADGLDEESGVRSTDKSTTTESLETGDASLHHVSTTQGQPTSQGTSSTESHLPTPLSSHSLLPNSTEKSQDTISESNSSLLLPVLSKAESITKSEAPSRTSQPTGTTLYVPTTDSAPKNTPEKLSAGLIAAIAVGGTLVFLLLIGAAVYCCLKRRIVRRSRSSSLIGKEDSSKEVNASAEWKPPVELPHQTMRVSPPELQDSPVPHSHLSELALSSPPFTPTTQSTWSPLEAMDLVELQGDPACVSPIELFVMPAELPGAYKS